MNSLTPTPEQAYSLIEDLNKKNMSLVNEVKYLNEQLALLRKHIFGKRSEKITSFNSNEQLLPGFELPPKPAQEKKVIPAHERKLPSKEKPLSNLAYPDDLPVERTFIDLKEEEKVCAKTGKPLVKIGEDITRKLAHKPGSYYIKEIVRAKYSALKEGEKTVISADLPDSIIPGSKVDESLLAEILIKKFADHLPLYRQSQIFSRESIFIPRQLLAKWVVKCGIALKPIFDKMTQLVLESNNVFVDEVPVDMLNPGKGSVKQTYMWVLVGGKDANPAYRVYNFRVNRRHEHAEELLKNYNGVLHSDKYGAYEKMAHKKAFIWCPCWAHIRRKFIEAEAGDLELREFVLIKIRDLFLIERVAWEKSEEERQKIRLEQEVPIIDELITTIKDKLLKGQALAKSKFKEALGYFCSLIPYLKNYTLHPYARLDNNVAERAVRPLALGRKNWLFLGSEEGGEAAAVILSLVQTCNALKINPREYLEDVMRRLPSHCFQKLEELLPDQWAKGLPTSN